MPRSTEIEQRNRALIAFTILTGARVSSIASAKLKHINLEEGSFYQDAREVNTKFSKTFTTFFFQVGEYMVVIVTDWINYLKLEKLYGNDDPLFPMNEIGFNEQQQFASIGIKPEHWSTASPIREIFSKSFKLAGLPYFNPHSFRNTLVQLAQVSCKTPEGFKAWSQNLGHESVLTTFYSYGEVSVTRQAELIKQSQELKNNTTLNSMDELANKLVERMKTEGMLLKI